MESQAASVLIPGLSVEIAYLAGLVWVRTLIWNASAIGIVILLWRLVANAPNWSKISCVT